ncbi:F390 synthetase-related protein [Chamaesiphon minutus]|uniref:Putative adenylate-forming enzyme n=1 Tax=Chamaesiphon minutus (strain ATCC 27169 / PCC 6605) TaxID=1173020 RepID=K9U8I8_CHAP6|nr:F390 synthetase-related protein [Chamaesiphon minutus]AFY91382.1 putative adenylate-forming enzyme [Chamaesiphon minutus PCC 6605]
MNDKLAIVGQYLLIKYGRTFKSRKQLLAWQNTKVVNFLHQVLPKSRFYRDRYEGLNLSDWQTFPIVDKSAMMANFDDLNTVGISKDSAFELAIEAETTRNFSPTIQGYTIGLSSGTSGNRGLFIVSPAERQIWAGTILAKALPHSIFTPERIAFFLRANSNLYETVRRQHIRFEYFDLFANLQNHIERLNRIEPTILVAPPSMLLLLAAARSSGDLKIFPEKIIAVAEVLDPLDETYLRECFSRPIHQLYQCTEGFLGSTCAYGTLHLNEDILVIQKEYIDRQLGKFMPIITDFNRRTQPIIRYRLDDILTERQDPCLCGSVFTALSSIEGRCDDLFWLPDLTGERLISIFPDFIRRAIMTASADIQAYRVVQISPTAIEVFVKVPPELQTSIEQQISVSLIDLFNRSHCQIPNIFYQEYVQHTEHRHKLRRVQRAFTPDNRSS